MNKEELGILKAASKLLGKLHPFNTIDFAIQILINEEIKRQENDNAMHEAYSVKEIPS